MPKIIKNPKETILKIAKHHLLDQGIETLNMRAIAKDAEISVGTLYNYFPNKDYIVITLMASFWREFLEEIEWMETEGQSFLEVLASMYRRLGETMKVFRTEWLSGEGFQSDQAKEEGAKRQAQYRNMVLSAIERQFVQFGITSEEFSQGELARFVLSNWLGMLTNSYLDYPLFERILIKTIKNKGEV